MTTKIQTIKDIRVYLAKELKDHYTQNEIRIISDMLIKKVTGLKSPYKLYDDHLTVSQADSDKMTIYSGELKRGKPLQYVTGETVFYDCIIKLNAATLIPRPETEELVDLIIKENKEFSGQIIDFGTGSGCIAIALAANLPAAIVKGTDISEGALAMARENAILNNVSVSFELEDIFNAFNDPVFKAGIIVSNPPYVTNSEKQFMARNVLDFEPHDALFVSDSDPLVYYAAILNIAEKILLPGGRLYFEINEMMGNKLAELIGSFDYAEIKIISDINSKERIIKAVRNV